MLHTAERAANRPLAPARQQVHQALHQRRLPSSVRTEVAELQVVTHVKGQRTG